MSGIDGKAEMMRAVLAAIANTPVQIMRPAPGNYLPERPRAGQPGNKLRREAREGRLGLRR